MPSVYCAICDSVFKPDDGPAIRVFCGHFFHEACVTQRYGRGWGFKAECFVCRKPMIIARRIFLNFEPTDQPDLKQTAIDELKRELYEKEDILLQLDEKTQKITEEYEQISNNDELRPEEVKKLKVYGKRFRREMERSDECLKEIQKGEKKLETIRQRIDELKRKREEVKRRQKTAKRQRTMRELA